MREWDREGERETCSWGNEWPVMCVWWSGGAGRKGGGGGEGEGGEESTYFLSDLPPHYKLAYVHVWFSP